MRVATFKKNQPLIGPCRTNFQSPRNSNDSSQEPILQKFLHLKTCLQMHPKHETGGLQPNILI